MTGGHPVGNITADDPVDAEIASYLDPDAPRSFFLFAGAGSGKTRSLVNALNHIRQTHGRTLAYRGQRVAVITYTNAACDEIIRRLDFNPLFNVSTIHSFAWTLIQDFPHDIREWLRVRLEADLEKLRAEEAKGRPGTKASITRLAQIESKSRRLARLDDIRGFSYSPSGDTSEPNALSHADVVSICAFFLSAKPLMQWILVGRFPILLIDESQDTNKHLVEAFFSVARVHEERFALGLVGDVMQRIYADGKERIEQGLPDSWAKPSKKLNHRCPKRVVKLINQIRSAVDNHLQEARSDATEGAVRLYIRPVGEPDRAGIEDRVREDMAVTTDDALWRTRQACKILTLEHHMAAKRLGFGELLESLLEVERWRTGLLDGSLPATRFFARDVLPLVQAARRGDDFAVATIARAKSPLISPDVLKGAVDVGEQLRRARASVESITELWAGGEPTVGAVLDAVSNGGFFSVPDVLRPVVRLRKAAVSDDGSGAAAADPVSTETAALLRFLETPFSQVESYAQYVSGLASFDTHQGVKGLEFDRVMVIMDDEEARGFMFGYDKLFGAKEPSERDRLNQAEGSETSLDRTRRLLYVTCSRAEKSLALIAYTDNPAAVKAQVIANGWFTEDEIDDGRA